MMKVPAVFEVLIRCLSVLLFRITLVGAFNLEPRLAVVKEGVPGSYFGFSVEQHQIINRDTLESSLLVGAPLDHDPSTGEPDGVVWKCPLTPRKDDCRPLLVDPDTRNKLRSSHNKRHHREKGPGWMGQWLGAVIKSQGPGKQVIACAPRYVKEESGGSQRWGHGKCFTLTSDLRHAATWDPCQGRPKNRAHEQWGYCQAGISALLTSDDNTDTSQQEDTSTVALIGAPGPYTWRGTVFALTVDGDFLSRDKTHYHTPVRASQAAPVDKYSYLGMSLAAGNFLPPHSACGKRSIYAAGAPRAGDTGKVVLFVKCQSDLMSVQRLLNGKSFASSFGYSLASLDLDGDGFSELVVGAPFLGSPGAVYVYGNSQDGLVEDEDRLRLDGRQAEEAREGRFGLSVANAGDLNADGAEDLVVGAPFDGRGKVFVYMGSAEHGWKNGKQPDQTIAAEHIRGRYPPATSFGFSLSGGLDVDLNNHSDIAVGAFESDMAVILRSRPVVQVVTWFGDRPSKIDADVPGCAADPDSEAPCFTVESCFLLKKFPSNIDRTYVRYRLSAEAFPGGRKISRVHFGHSKEENSTSSSPPHVATRTVAVFRESLTGCFLETAYLREGISDLTTPIDFQLDLRLEQDEVVGDVRNSRAIPNINQFPVLEKSSATKVISLPFQKWCGEDDICNSQLSVKLSITPGYDPLRRRLEVATRTEVRLILDVSNTGEPAYAATAELDIDPAFYYVGRSDNVTAINCDFDEKESKVFCKLGNPYTPPPHLTERLVFRVLPKRDYGDESASSVIQHASFAVKASTTSEDVGGHLKGEAVDLQVVKRHEVALRTSVQPETIWYGGAVRGESAMKVMPDIGSKVTHTFQISNDGPWHVGDENLDLLIDWPFQLRAPSLDGEEGYDDQSDDESDLHSERPGKWLLYLASEAEVSPPGAATCFLNPRMINHLGLRDRAGGVSSTADASLPKRRRRRESTNFEDESISSSSSLPLDEGVTINCINGRARCMVLNCRLWHLRAGENVVIRLRSRVWNSTLVEDFWWSPGVRVEVRARLLLHPDAEALQSTEDDSATAVLTAISSLPPSGGGGLGAVPPWLILVAAIVGLALVVLIALVLYKLGFFKRHRHRDATKLMISAKVTRPSRMQGDEYTS